MNRAAIACCCLLAAAVQARVIDRSPTPSADTLRYVEVAQRHVSAGWLQGLRSSDEHPLYPLLIASVVAGCRDAGQHSHTWVDAAQLISAFCAVAAIPLAWLAFRECVAPRAALCAVVALALWPMLARAGADGLADSLQLAAIAAGWASLSRGGAWRATMAGVLLGVGTLARTEAWIVAAAFVLVEATMPTDAPRSGVARAARVAALLCGLSLAPSLLLALSKPSDAGDALARVLGRPRSGVSHAQPSTASANPSLIPLKERAVSSRFGGVVPAAHAFAREVGNAGGWIWLPLGLGIAASWRQRSVAMGVTAAARAAGVVAAFCALGVIAAASRLGYLTERHAWVPLFFLFPWVGLGLTALADLLVEASTRIGRLTPFAGRVVMSLTMSALLALAVAKACQPVHLSRIHHRHAARWLAADAQPGAVLDTRGWTALYSGRATYRIDRAAAAVRDPQLAYVVIEARELAPSNLRSAALHDLLTAGGELAQRCGADHDGRNAVLIYRWHPERYAARRGADSLALLEPNRDA